LRNEKEKRNVAYEIRMNVNESDEERRHKREAMRSFVPNLDSELSREVCQIKYEFPYDATHFVLTAYLNNFIGRVGEYQRNQYVFRKRPGDLWERRSGASLKKELEKYEVHDRNRERKVNPFNVWLKNELRREYEKVVWTEEPPHEFVDRTGKEVLNTSRVKG
jgi:phage-related protein